VSRPGALAAPLCMAAVALAALIGFVVGFVVRGHL
jgi:hypothetical protein